MPAEPVRRRLVARRCRSRRSCAVNGVDPTGVGRWLGAPLTRARSIGAADAVLDPDGRVQHAASDDALRAAQEALRDSVLALERLRGARKRTREGAIADWKGLVSARWSIVDQFDRDGRRFVVAQRNEPTTRGVEALTPRELQVARFVAMGHTNKLVAYELGIAHSTVRVLLSRAMTKLGVKTRDALVLALQPAET